MMETKHEEINFRKDFCERYFDEGTWDLDVLNEVDVLLKDAEGQKLLYIEAKYKITGSTEHRQALAQLILTNKKQEAVLSYVALIYQDAGNNNVLELVDCSEDAVMYNNDFNWNAEKPSSPSRDAIDRINDRLIGRITQYKNDEIAEFYHQFKTDNIVEIQISLRNFTVVYNHWKNEVAFKEIVRDEQDWINLFLVDMLNGTQYQKEVMEGDIALANNEKPIQASLFGNIVPSLIREGTNLNNYAILCTLDGIRDGIRYSGNRLSFYYTLANLRQYENFWRKYKRPPHKTEFLKILEHSNVLYSDKYRRDTGGEYTPTFYVQTQNEILAKYYNLDEFLVFDPCAGVGNLENQFGKDYKQFCFLSTLEQMDVDTCKIKGFDNVVRYDFLKSGDLFPTWKYYGTDLGINEICKREGRKLMVIMNPPYQNKKGLLNNTAIEFFNKVLMLKPQVIVLYYMTESFLREEVENYVNSGYGIVSHIFTNARVAFGVSTWPVSQVIFDKDCPHKVSRDVVTADRYEYNKKDDRLHFIKSYTYNNSQPSLFKALKVAVKDHQTGMILGNYSYIHSCINLTNKPSKNANAITTNNLRWCLLSKGLCFNTDAKYFEWNDYVYRGKIEDISDELFSDAIMFSMFYLGCAFTNYGQKNYIMPFKAAE